MNSIVSPALAVMVSGVKTSPFLPTATWWTFDTEAAAAALVAVVEGADDPESPYWLSALGSRHVKSSRENDEYIMVDAVGAGLTRVKSRKVSRCFWKLCGL